MWYQLIGVVLTVLSKLSGPGFPVQSSADIHSCGMHSLSKHSMGSHMCMDNTLCSTGSNDNTHLLRVLRTREGSKEFNPVNDDEQYIRRFSL